ncbi:MAG: tRNA pseudouridine(38-40) synthase TruA, partial [Candidatus Omnitrophota bacterium]
WQSQKSSDAIQDVFEKILSRIFKRPVSILGSSRTDSGVHAEGLVAHIRVDRIIKDPTLKKALNFHLPKDIVVKSVRTVADDFHARYHAKSKIYRYRIWNDSTRTIFEAPFVLWCSKRLDLGLMRRAARLLIGRNDFGAFKDDKDKTRTNVRTLKRIVIRRDGPRVTLGFEGDGFLTHMVRVIVGTLMEVGCRKILPERIGEILKSKNRTLAGPTAPACGLTLVKVKY